MARLSRFVFPAIVLLAGLSHVAQSDARPADGAGPDAARPAKARATATAPAASVAGAPASRKAAASASRRAGDTGSAAVRAAKLKAVRHGQAVAAPRTLAYKSGTWSAGAPTRVALAARPGDPGRISVGHAAGLRAVEDPLELRSSVALLADQRSSEILFAKNPEAVLPIASITKVMTAMVVLDTKAPLDELLEITADDVDTEKGSRSRLRPGVRLSRAELLQLALMASENRAAHALGRHHPEGLEAFVQAMNAKARQLGMQASRFNDPTGLSGRNVSNAYDLARMLRAAYDYPLIRQYSTASDLTVDTGTKALIFRNTNRLIERPNWSIGLQKTGYIAEAGRCLVMQVQIHDRPMLMVLLDSDGRHSRYGDAQRIRDWLEAQAARPPVMQSGRDPAGRATAVRYASAGS